MKCSYILDHVQQSLLTKQPSALSPSLKLILLPSSGQYFVIFIHEPREVTYRLPTRGPEFYPGLGRGSSEVSLATGISLADPEAS